jgi:hypothetical protein
MVCKRRNGLLYLYWEAYYDEIKKRRLVGLILYCYKYF